MDSKSNKWEFNPTNNDTYRELSKITKSVVMKEMAKVVTVEPFDDVRGEGVKIIIELNKKTVYDAVFSAIASVPDFPPTINNAFLLSECVHDAIEKDTELLNTPFAGRVIATEEGKKKLIDAMLTGDIDNVFNVLESSLGDLFSKLGHPDNCNGDCEHCDDKPNETGYGMDWVEKELKDNKVLPS
jgi:hypothetical protein